MKIFSPCSKFFLVIFISLFTSQSFARCVNVLESEIEFIKNGENMCNRAQDDALPKYTDVISGGDYYISFHFDRNDEEFTEGTKQTLFAIYDDAEVLLARAYIEKTSGGGKFIYECASCKDTLDGVDIGGINNDTNITEPYGVNISYSQKANNLAININNYEAIIDDVQPINSVNNIKIGGESGGTNPFIGKIGLFGVYDIYVGRESRIVNMDILAEDKSGIKLGAVVKDINGVIQANTPTIECATNHVLHNNICVNPCYHSDFVGQVAETRWSDCADKLIVDRSMLLDAASDDSFDFKPGDSYTTHTGNTYTFASGANNIFTGSVTDMSQLFRNKTTFNQDISHWDVSNVTNMVGMFENAQAFNQDISGWDVSSVTNMHRMFRNGKSFNSPLTWGSKVRNVNNMSEMFYDADGFNQDLSSWDVSSVTNMANMFRSNFSFAPTNIFQNVSNVRNMNNMFRATNFNADITNWDVRNVTDMGEMFRSNNSINQDLSTAWCVENVNKSSLFNNDSSSLISSFLPPFGTSDNCN